MNETVLTIITVLYAIPHFMRTVEILLNFNAHKQTDT